MMYTYRSNIKNGNYDEIYDADKTTEARGSDGATSERRTERDHRIASSCIV